MVRPKRIDFPFMLYHILSRTNSGDFAFLDQRDYHKFLHYLGQYVPLFSFRLHAFCLMPTHFHLLLESRENPSLSEMMRRLLTAYTVYFNRRYQRHGHLFQGRFKSYVVDKAEYLLAVSRYIHLNPASPGNPSAAEAYQASSLRYYLHGGEPAFLHTAEILSWFNGDRKKFAGFVRSGLNQETKPEVIQQRYIGGEAFIKRLKRRIRFRTGGRRRSSPGSSPGKSTSARSEEKKTARLITRVAKHFQVPEKRIRRGLAGHGNLGHARTTVVALLFKHVPWSYSRIAKYMGFKNISSVDYHLGRAKKDPPVLSALKQCDIPDKS